MTNFFISALLRQPNSGKIYRKVGRTHCGNDFLNTLLDSSSPHQTFIPSDTWILSIHLHPPPPCTQHSHTIYTQRPSFSVPFILYKKLFYSTKLTDHHSSSPSAAQSQPLPAKPNNSYRATFAGSLENLSPARSALFADHSLSEPLRGEFELSANAFS